MSDLKAAAVRGARTAIFTFLGTFLPAVLNFLHGVSEWAASSGTKPVPTTSTLVYAAVSAATAAFSGLIAFGWNWVENTQGFALFGAKKDKQS